MEVFYGGGEGVVIDDSSKIFLNGKIFRSSFIVINWLD